MHYMLLYSVIPPKEGTEVFPLYLAKMSLIWSLECIRPFDVIVLSILSPSLL